MFVEVVSFILGLSLLLLSIILLFIIVKIILNCNQSHVEYEDILCVEDNEWKLKKRVSKKTVDDILLN